MDMGGKLAATTREGDRPLALDVGSPVTEFARGDATMRILLTGARAPATLELARLCTVAGHEVHVADSQGWHVCRGSRLVQACHRLPPARANHAAYAIAVRALAERFDIDLVVPTCEEIFHLAAVADRIGTPIRSESLSRLTMLHDKAAFVAACAMAGVPAPPTYDLAHIDPGDLPAGAYILKRRFSRFATHVTVWQSDTPFPSKQPRDGWVAQAFIRGQALCTWGVAHEGRLLAHTCYAVDATAGVRGAAIAFHSVHHAGARAWVERFVRAHRLCGQVAFDLIDDAGLVTGIECNPRLTSGIHCFRGMPGVVETLTFPSRAAAAPTLEPPEGLAFRSRLALRLYAHPSHRGAGLLDADDDPWPRRLQGITWSVLLLQSLRHRVDPRAMSTRDIEWNGE
jgi:hypothetical protein